MNITDFIDFSFIDIIDILLVALLLFYLYKLVRGTVAINIFIGIVIIYLIWRLTDLLSMDVLSNILGNFISVGFFALIVVFQQEIRRFLLLLGSTNFTNRRNVIRYFKFLNQSQGSLNLNLNIFVNSCFEMSKNKTGAIIVLKRTNTLDFTLNESNFSQIRITPQVLESVFFKNSPLHDGAIIIENNTIVATRVILPVSESSDLPSSYGLRHRAALGITEKTDSIVVVISEQTGKIVYFKGGEFIKIKSKEMLNELVIQDLNK
ncbi:MAG: TIGR00159 family protein [Flavobacteriaceae bacterium]|nr:TIGR00159 family protein [Flavobacteriaceae bacterium]